MPPLDFPNSPTTGQTYTGPGGVVWSFDSQKWVNGASATAFAPINAPVFTGDARAVTATAGDNDTSIATTAFVQTAVGGIPGTNYNYADNSGFSVNQRGYTTGSALAAGVYGFDRWKAGAGGCTITFTAAPPATTLTITAGTLQQVVEGASVVGGNYMLSWTGTAQGRVGAGSYAASPVALTGITAGANTTIEFNAGTLGRVKLEAGTAATPWLAKAARDELANCQRFYQTGRIISGAYTTSTLTVYHSMLLPVPMRATPAFAATNGSVNIGSFVVSGSSTYIYVQGQATATGAYIIDGNPFTANADL